MPTTIFPNVVTLDPATIILVKMIGSFTAKPSVSFTTIISVAPEQLTTVADNGSCVSEIVNV